jgi:hypothetical protein
MVRGTQVLSRIGRRNRGRSDRSELRLHPIVWLALAPVACTTILNIDGHYVAVSSAGGRPVDSGSPTQESGVVASGGSPVDGSGGVIVIGVGGANAGGAVVQSSGGSTSGGTNGAGGGGTGGTVVVVPDCSQNPNICKAGEKCCGSPATNDKGCYVPSPLVGCSLSGCDHCTNTAPANATQACVEGTCAFACNPGFNEKNGACIPMTTGAGGTDAGPTGAGGSPCVPRQCAGCGPAGPFGCCQLNGTCGCTYFDLAIGGRVGIGYCAPYILPPRP